MRKHTQIELLKARDERDEGMRIAVDHADAVTPNWSEHALNWVRLYCKTNKEPFVCDELREWSEPRGCMVPISSQAWGSVMVKACKDGVIKKLGYTTCIFPNRTNTHAKPVAQWQSVTGITA
jgi:hypothetical protein